MSAKSYIEKLRDPRWQKVRLEVLQRDKWKCTSCGASDNTLHVHHGYYEKGKQPWEYPQDSLRTLCEECHESIQEDILEMHKEIAFMHPEELRCWLRLIQKFYRVFEFPESLFAVSSPWLLPDSEFVLIFRYMNDLVNTRHKESESQGSHS